MGHDGLRIGVKMIRKFVIRPTRKCCRSVYNHPFLVFSMLMLLYLYRSSPFLFSLLVSASPVLVCTAVLLGTLLSFGDHSISTVTEDDETFTPETAELRTGLFERSTVVEKDESFGKDSAYTELKSEIVERSFGEESLLDIVDRGGNYERGADLVISSMPSISREIEFEKQTIHEPASEFDSVGAGEAVHLSYQMAGREVDDGVGHEILEDRSCAVEKVHSEVSEDCNVSEKRSIDVQVRDHLESFMVLERGMDDVLSDRLSTGLEGDVEADRLENRETADTSIDSHIRDQLELPSGSWTQYDVLADRLSSVKKIQVDNFEDYISAEGSLDAQLGSPLELSLGSWNHMDSDHDGDDDSDSGSDGAESSSPDASMADIIPMLDELHPLLEDETPHTSNLSCHGSAASSERLGNSCNESIASDDGSDQWEEDETGDVKSDRDDDNEEETQDGKEDPPRSPVMWTEQDQKNLMDLGTSDLERNQRLESLIVRRRAKRMVTESNLLDLEGMDLSFPIQPISTSRYNPFDNAQDSYAHLGLPPIPGSAPSVLRQRRNPFDLPYDSSEEKPDLTGDNFQEEFMELAKRESANQRFFRRNETFSVGSSMFDFGRQATRASRFRPYFVPERTDSDVMSHSSFERQYSELSESRMSYSSLQRQLSELSESRMSYSSLQRQSSELSESKASSAADTDMTYTVGDLDRRKLFDHESGQEIEQSPDIGQPSDNSEHKSECSENVAALSDEENDTKYVDRNLPVIEMSGEGNSLTATSYTSEVGQPAEVTEAGQLAEVKEAGQPAEVIEAGKGICLEEDYGLSLREVSYSKVQLVGESIDINHSSSSSLSVPNELNDVKDDDYDRGQVHNLENVDNYLDYALETSVSDIPTVHSHEEPECRLGTEAEEGRPREPIYDSSPLATMRNPSSSSIGSDLHRESSEMDLYHVQRDLFAEDEPKIHDKDVEGNGLHRRQEPGDSGFSADDIDEVTGHSSIGSQFVEQNQKPSNSRASMAGYDFNFSEDSWKLLRKEFLDDEIPPKEGEQVPTQGDYVEGHHRGKVDSNVANISFTGESKCSEDLFSAPQEKQIDSNLSSSEVELKEDIGMAIGGSEHILPSVSNLKYHNNDTSKELFFALDEAHFLPHDSSIYDPQKQVTSVERNTLEEFVQVNEGCESADVLEVQEPENNMLSCLLQNDKSSSQLEKLEKIPVSELAVEKIGQDICATKISHPTEEHNSIAQDLDESVADELIMFEEKTGLKEMDENLLSELDVVGDFSLKNVTPNFNNSYPDAKVNSSIPEQVLFDDHSSSGIEFGESTSLVDINDVQQSKSASVTSEPNLSLTKELISDSRAGDITANLLVLEHQSSEDMDASFPRVCEEKVQRFVADESSQAENKIVSETNLAWSEETIPDSRIGDDNVGFLIPEDQSDKGIGAAFQKVSEEEVQKYAVAESIQAEDTVLSDQNLTCSKESVPDSSIGEASAGLLVIEDQSYEAIDAWTKVSEEEAQEPRAGGSVQSEQKIEEMEATFAKSELSEEATEPVSQATEVMSVIDTTLNDSEPVPERSEPKHDSLEGDILYSCKIEPQTEISADTEVSEPSGEDFHVLKTDTDNSIGSESLETTTEPGCVSEVSLPLHVDRDTKATVDSPAVGTVIAPPVQFADEMERSDSVELKLLQKDTDLEKMVDSPVLEVCASDFESGHKVEKVGSIGSESMQYDRDSVHKTKALPVLETSIPPTVEFEDQSKGVAFVKSEPLTLNADTEGVHKPLVAEASFAYASESECQIETEGSSESELLITDRRTEPMQKSDVEASTSFHGESENHIQIVGELESEQPISDGDLKGIQEFPVVEASVASTAESEDQRTINSQTEVVEVQDHLVASHQKPEAGSLKSEDAEEVQVDSSATMSQLNKREPGAQGSNKSASENSSLQFEEEKSHESHLEFSSGSSNSG